MRFRQLDKITEIELGRHLEAVKWLSSEEGYLKDHFPRFPLMPGVLMLEAMFQAAQWLVRESEDFVHSTVSLKEARNVKFGGFVRPGQTLTVTADIKKQRGPCTTLMTRGLVDGEVVVTARLVLECSHLGETDPVQAPTDAYLRRCMRQKYASLTQAEGDGRPDEPLTMRWMWIDRLVEFVRGERAVAVKNVSMTEEPLDEYQPGFPVMPCSLILEGMALTGGILANDQRDFQERIVLAKINKAMFHRPAVPGDQLKYTATIQSNQSEGVFLQVSSHVGEQLQAEAELFLAYLEESVVQQELIDPADTLRMLRLFGLYDTGRTRAGEALAVPEYLLDAERNALMAMEV
jgi:3-hydroxyacyl-[acyl-carrier-protein] dehydratase